MTMAGNKSKFPEQKYLLREALDHAKLAEKEEKMHIANGVKNSVFVFSTLLDDRNSEKFSGQFYPFNEIYNPKYISEQIFPGEPVLIARSSSSITLKFPPYTPQISEHVLLQYP
jgi:hypothetical protein